MAQTIDIKKQNKEALKWILDIHDLRKSYFESMATFATLGAVADDGLPKGTGTSNPCMNKALSLVDMENRKKWIISIEQMEQTLSEKSRKFLEIRRDAEHQPNTKNEPGRPGWVNYTMAKYTEWHYYRYGGDFTPSVDQMKKWTNMIIDTTVRIAIKNGAMYW